MMDLRSMLASSIVREGQMPDVKLSEEQETFVRKAKEGKNILVDACIGSGKTTSIQHLCVCLPDTCRILYLTYNRLLKLDAKSKIVKNNVEVQNYHGFASKRLARAGYRSGVTDLIQNFLRVSPPIPRFDLLLIDEYQDIDQELSEMLLYIKESCPGIQIIAVGDMEQKLYDKTSLNARQFIEILLGDGYEKIEFTRCFRLSEDFAARLGRIWKKKIVGVNAKCSVQEMSFREAVKFLSKQKPCDILCLGQRTGDMAKALNELEYRYPEKYNKRTVYASILDNDSYKNTDPKAENAIFTTYDGSKGLERKICVIFNYVHSYWNVRIRKPQQSYEILRNIFCVAASRGKEQIIFVKSSEDILGEDILSLPVRENHHFNNMDISTMFDFKYKEDIEASFKLLDVHPCLNRGNNSDGSPKDEDDETGEAGRDDCDNSIIKANQNDELIDLCPCVSTYQKAIFFSGYSVDRDIEMYFLMNPDKAFHGKKKLKDMDTEDKVLFLTSLETSQNRYRDQVEVSLMDTESKNALIKRLSSEFVPDEDVQVNCSVDFATSDGNSILFSAVGKADTIKNGIAYTLVFTTELSHEHFLQCAMYSVALGLKKGIIWNTMNNTMYEVCAPDSEKFLDAVIKTVTKGLYTKYVAPNRLLKPASEIKHESSGKDGAGNFNTLRIAEKTSGSGIPFAVIDIETNWDNEAMSVGILISDDQTFEIKDWKYYILSPQWRVGGMYSSRLRFTGQKATETDPVTAAQEISGWLKDNGVNSLFAYNASFDARHFPWLSGVKWVDIMKKAAYKQHNPYISPNAETCKTGRLKRNYSVEAIYRLVTGKQDYYEEHNALLDAIDELEIMKRFGTSVKDYQYCVLQATGK